MINKRFAHRYCKDRISKIENYEKALVDVSQTYHLHHRDEIRTLPSGMIVCRSREELIENGRYYNCPANELIFLTKYEHNSLHHKGKTMTMEVRKKISDATKGEKSHMYGTHLSIKTRMKISKATKGRRNSIKSREKMSKARKGKPLSPRNRLNKAKAQYEIGLKYREYKSSGGTMTYNEFRASIKKSP